MLSIKQEEITSDLGLFRDANIVRALRKSLSGFPAEEKCRADVDSFLNGLENSRIWSFRMLDASTKIPASLLTGNFIDLGGFDECLSVHSDDSSIRGKHCLASLALGNKSEGIPNFLWSYCIPESCSATSLAAVLNASIPTVIKGYATVAESDCQVKSTGEVSTLEVFSIALCSIVALLCIASTAYDVILGSNKKSNGVLKSFSISANGKRLLSTHVATSALRPLHGIRFLTIAWIILGHRYFFMMTSPIINSEVIPKFLEAVELQLIAGGNMGVDTFFLISGLLNSYHLLDILNKSGRFPALKYYIHRYIRTTPALAAMILIYVGWYPLIGDGPLWLRTTYYNKQFCSDNWWLNLLYINNYVNQVNQCAGQSWYLAVDMQLYWLSPLVIIPCWKWPRIRKFYLGSLLLISTAVLFSVAYLDKIRMPYTISSDLDEYKRVTKSMYVPTHTRATPYIIGLMVGFFLDSNRKSRHIPAVPKHYQFVGWLISIALSLSVIFGNYPLMLPETSHPYDRMESSFYIALFRIAWSIAMSWIIIACVYGFGGPVNSILSWKGFLPLSRLTYCIFLSHLAVQQYQLGTERTNSYFQTFNQVHRFLGDLGMAVLCSAVLFLMFESPVIAIESYLRKPRKPVEDGTLNAAYVNDEQNGKSP